MAKVIRPYHRPLILKAKEVIMIKLLNIDCMEYMKGLEENAFELAIVDPPYGIGESGGNESRNRVKTNNYLKKNWDKSAPSPEYFIELQRVSKNQIIWGANHFMQNLHLGSPCWIVWDKLTGGSDFADCELAYTSFKSAVRKFKFMWSGMLQGDMKKKNYAYTQHKSPLSSMNGY